MLDSATIAGAVAIFCIGKEGRTSLEVQMSSIHPEDLTGWERARVDTLDFQAVFGGELWSKLVTRRMKDVS